MRDCLESICEKFEVHTTWSWSAPNSLTSIPTGKLKLIIPALSYYFSIEPGAALNQNLDFGVKLQDGARSQLAAKTSYAKYILPYTSERKVAEHRDTVPVFVRKR